MTSTRFPDPVLDSDLSNVFALTGATHAGELTWVEDESNTLYAVKTDDNADITTVVTVGSAIEEIPVDTFTQKHTTTIERPNNHQ